MMDTEWFSTSNTDSGTVWTAGLPDQSPAGTAFSGTNMGGVKDNYGPDGCEGNATSQLIENEVTEVSYTSATLSCSYTTVPIPAGTWQCTNGQNMKPLDNNFYPYICILEK